jgi:hypothetical protein
VGVRKILEEEAEFAQALGLHEVSVIDDGDEHLAGAMEAEGFLDEQAFAVMVAALELDLEGAAEDAESVVISVEGAIDHRGNQAFGVMIDQGLFEHRFAGARLAQDQAKAALLGVDFEDVQDLLLVFEQGELLGVEGIALETEVRADHKPSWS